MLENWKKYLDIDFAQRDGDGYKIDGYVYYIGETEDKPYRNVQFNGCYIPIDHKEEVWVIEARCKQYINECTEQEAKEIIEWYLENMIPLP